MAESDEVACAEIGQAEAFAAFHRKLREGFITKTAFDAVAQQFESDITSE